MVVAVHFRLGSGWGRRSAEPPAFSTPLPQQEVIVNNPTAIGYVALLAGGKALGNQDARVVVGSEHWIRHDLARGSS